MKLSRRSWWTALAAAALTGGSVWALADSPSAPGQADTRPADCCCIETDAGLVCTITGEVLSECCCR